MTPEETRLARNAAARRYYWRNVEKCRQDARERYVRLREQAKTDPELAAKLHAEYLRGSRRAAGAKNPCGTRPTGACTICQAVVKLCYDHDHETGEFRGWLCSNCNNGIGHFKDSPERCEAAAAYLRLTKA